MKDMVFISGKGDKIVFDDWVDNTKEFQSYWAEICPHCLSKYQGVLEALSTDGAMGTCSVKGCMNEAEYYVDFSKDVVSFL